MFKNGNKKYYKSITSNKEVGNESFKAIKNLLQELNKD